MKIFWWNFQGLLTTPFAINPENSVKNLLSVVKKLHFVQWDIFCATWYVTDSRVSSAGGSRQTLLRACSSVVWWRVAVNSLSLPALQQQLQMSVCVVFLMDCSHSRLVVCSTCSIAWLSATLLARLLLIMFCCCVCMSVSVVISDEQKWWTDFDKKNLDGWGLVQGPVD